MKERNTHAGNVITRQQIRVVSLNIWEQYMKARNTYAVNVIIRQLQRVVSTDTTKQYTKFPCSECY